mgnify:CR=1 FL=1
MTTVIDKKYLDEFKYLGDAVYLDWGCLGLLPERTREHCRNFMDEYCDSFARVALCDYDARREDARHEIAKLIGARTDEIAFMANTTAGNNVLATGLKFARGDNVIIADNDYYSNVNCWINKQREGVELRIAPTEHGVLDEGALIRMIDSRTRAVVLSYVSHSTGYRADVSRIGAECRRHGAIFAVDAIQAVGRQAIDVNAENIDVLSSGSFKGALGVLGCAFFYCRGGIAQLIAPSEYGDNCDTGEFGYTKKVDAAGHFTLYEDCRRFEAGSLNTYGITAAGISVGLLNEIGINRVSARIAELEAYFRVRAKSKLPMLDILGSSDPACQSGNICCLFDHAKTGALKRAMEAWRVYTTVEGGYMRLAVHYCNTEADIDRAVDAIIEGLR